MNSNVQVSCTYGPSLHPALFINIYVPGSLINMTYTMGYSPPPSIIANANAYIVDAQNATYVETSGLNRVFSLPITNTDIIQGDSQDHSPGQLPVLHFARSCWIMQNTSNAW
jgi:hypothetical protein